MMSGRRAAVGNRWGGLSVASRVFVAVLALAGVVIALRVLGERATRGTNPDGPPSSSRSGAPFGVAAFRELLERYDVSVTERKGALDEGRGLDSRSTVIVLDAATVTGDESSELQRFLFNGGHLVASGSSLDWLDRVLISERAPQWEETDAKRWRVRVDGQELHLDTAGNGQFAVGEGRRLYRRLTVGSGRVSVLADTSPLQNDRLAKADNAAFGLLLVGVERPVVFAEGVHGFGRVSGVGAIPFPWKVAMVATMLAGLLTALARTRRLGPPEDASRDLPPPRGDYVQAMATILARAEQPAIAFAPLQAEVQRRLLALAPGAAAVEDRARMAGLTDDETAALTSPVHTEAAVLALGRAVAQTADLAPTRARPTVLETTQQEHP